jgi:hypothetical protein
MQKFAAAVTFLRKGWRSLYVGGPLAVTWYFLAPYCSTWVWLDHYYNIWQFKHRILIGEIVQHTAIGWLIALGFSALSGLLVFIVWVFYTKTLDLEFTRSSVGALLLGSFLVGLSGVSGPAFNIHFTSPMACGLALLLLETKRMRVLAATY